MARKRSIAERSTAEVAHVLRWEDIGSLEPGNRADLCVVDRNPLGCPVEELPGTEVLATLLGGEAVHGELSSATPTTRRDR